MKKIIFLGVICLILTVSFFGCAHTNQEDIEPIVMESTGAPVQEEKEPSDQGQSSVSEEENDEKESASVPPSSAETDSAPQPQEENKPRPTDEKEFSDLKSMMKELSPERHIVFKGRKLRNEEPVAVERTKHCFPAVIEVLEPYFGDVKKGDSVILWERMGTAMVESDVEITYVDTKLEPLNSAEDYIFILTLAGDHYDYTYREYTYTKVSDRAALASKVKSGKATKLEQFRSSVLETYLQEPA